MEAVAKLPLSLAERLEYDHTLRLPATWEEFLYLLPRCDYRIEFFNGKILSFMGYASEDHETIVATLIRLIGNIVADKDFTLTGSNLALHVPVSGKRYLNADCTLVAGPSEKVQLSTNMYAVANPVLLVEVLSKTTFDFDLRVKSPLYRQIPSLRQLLLVDSEQLAITSLTRRDDTDAWVLHDYFDLMDEIDILDQGKISMKDIYRKVQF